MPPFRRSRPRAALLRLALAGCALAVPAAAQDVGREAAVVGSEAERYLRALQVAGEAPLYPWSVRGFSPAEIDRLLPDDPDLPWAHRTRPDSGGVHLLRPRVDAAWNSGFATGGNDGAVWAGRGATVSGSLGAAARFGALSVRLEPTAFWTGNGGFALMPHRLDSIQPFADPEAIRGIDLPQRFGDEAYGRVDPGQSTVRLDAGGVAVGVSTANQHWGPAIDQPLLLGSNAPGFAHAFVGTASPWKVGVGRVHGRMVWGRLDQSPYSLVEGDDRTRFMAGFTGVLLPWGLDGVEIGLSRFFHIPYGDGGPDAGDFLRPLESFFKVSLGPETDTVGTRENQLASVTLRWVLPRAGAEFYGEYARDDHNYNFLDFLLQPDHASSYLLGGSRAWRRGRSLWSVRAEWVSSQASNLAEVRNQGRLYRNAGVRQGHTHRGQLLGSPAAWGGGGSVVALEAFTPRGRWSVDWTRTRVRDNWTQTDRTEALTDVVHSLGGEAVFFVGGADLRAGTRASWELNRNLDGDAFNLTGSLGVRVPL